MLKRVRPDPYRLPPADGRRARGARADGGGAAPTDRSRCRQHRWRSSAPPIATMRSCSAAKSASAGSDPATGESDGGEHTRSLVGGQFCRPVRRSSVSGSTSRFSPEHRDRLSAGEERMRSLRRPGAPGSGGGSRRRLVQVATVIHGSARSPDVAHASGSRHETRELGVAATSPRGSSSVSVNW